MKDVLKTVIIQNGNFIAEILPNYGAAVNAYKFNEHNFIDGYASVQEITQQQYKGVILAPFPNRLAAAQYNFENKSYTLPINREKENLALHGLLYNESFEIIQQIDNELTLYYVYDANEAGYPFKFSLTINYILHVSGRLEIQSWVENLGTSMPFGLGWHPYFQMDVPVDELELAFPPCDWVQLDLQNIPTGVLHPYEVDSDFLFMKNQHFDDCFALREGQVNQFKIRSKQFDLIVESPSLGDFAYFQLYTPASRTSIAVEPMTCAPNAFNNGMGLHVLSPKQKRQFSYSIQAINRKN